MSTLPSLIQAMLGDVTALNGIAANNLLSFSGAQLITRLLQRRRREAIEIYLEEIRSGDRLLGPEEMEQAASITYAYIRAAEEGAARRNLRLMARVIAGQHTQKELFADEFLRFASFLPTLNREEVILLGTVASEFATNPRYSTPSERSLIVAGPRLLKMGWSEAEFGAAQAGLLRTGLITQSPRIGGSMAYFTTPLFDRLASLARFESYGYEA